ncbi:MAG: AgmX/PglI C-terminal domain-containing protein [Bradymonadales bacterium]|nr:AgmX/PglI C-terminal domain-containing protein [Bradymonadales bacterium]
MSEPVLVFEFLLGDRVVRTERIAREFVKIGSLPTSHLQIKDPQVSGIHAVVEVSGDTVYCIDLGSSSGTVVDGERTNKAQLSNGSILEFGSTRLRFHLERPVATELGAVAAVIRGEAGEEAQADQSAFRYVQILNRPSDAEHYSRRFLSQPSRTDGTVEVAHLWRDHVMAEYVFGKHSGLRPRDAFLFFALWFVFIIPLGVWLFQRVGKKKRSQKLTVGPSKNCDILIEDESLPQQGFDLLTRDSDGASYLHLRPQMEGDVYIDDTRYEVDEVFRQSGERGLKIGERTRVRLRFGDNTLFVHQGTRPKLALPFGGFEAHTWFFIFISIVLHGLLMGLIFLTPPDTRALSVDSFNLEERLVTIIQMEEEPQPEEIPDILEEETGEEDETLAVLEHGPEGRAGDEQTEEENRRMAIEGPERNREIRLDMRQAREEASTRGALMVLANTQGPGSLFGHVSAAGYDDVSAAGGLYGDTIGLAEGYGGLGLSGGGLSGGGFGGGGLSYSRGFNVGPISTRGRYGGGDDDLGRDLRMRERGGREIDVQLGQAEVDGFLDREIIARVIRQHRREIRACYQRELQSNPDLQGRVVVHFTIGPTGAVVGARIDDTTLNNSNVEECVVRRILRFQFPEPSTPGLVHVNYPFFFTAGGAD